MSALAASPTMTPAHQGQLLGFEISAAVMAAPTAPRSPRQVDLAQDQGEELSEAMQVMKNAALDEQVTMCRGEELRLGCTWKMMMMRIRPGQDGQRAVWPVADPLPPGAGSTARPCRCRATGGRTIIPGRSSPAGSTPVLAAGSILWAFGDGFCVRHEISSSPCCGQLFAACGRAAPGSRSDPNAGSS